MSSEFGVAQFGGPVNQTATGIVRAVGVGSVVEVSEGTTIHQGSVHTEHGGLISFGSPAGPG